MAGPDLSLITNAPNLTDRIMQQQQFSNQQAGAQIDTKTKQNIYATQLLSAATAPIGKTVDGQPVYNEPLYQRTLQQLSGMGMDVSGLPTDAARGAQYANAAKWSQSSYGALANFGVKNEANLLTAGAQTNNAGPANAALNGTGGIPGVPGMPGSGGLNGLPVMNSDGSPYTGPPTASMLVPKSVPVAAPADKTPTPPAVFNADGTPYVEGVVKTPAALAPPATAAPTGDTSSQTQVAASAPQTPQPALSTVVGAPAPPKSTGTVVGPAALPPEPTPPVIRPYDSARDGLYSSYQKQQELENTSYNQARAAYGENLDVIRARASAKAGGDIAGTLPEMSAKATEASSRIDKNLNSMLVANPDVPQSRWSVDAATKAYISQNYGDQTSAQAYSGFTKVNKAQVLNGIQELVQSGSIRNSKALINLVADVNAIDVNASPDIRAQQIQQVRSEIHNLAISASNVNARINGGTLQEYENIPTTGKALITPSDAAIQALQANPDKAADFDKAYGSGASQVFMAFRPGS